MTTLEVGVILPSIAVQRRENLDLPTAARHAEDLGLDSVWHGDHLAIGIPTLDCTIALAAAAAGTQRIRIGASVSSRPSALSPGPPSRSPACSTYREAG